MNEYNIYTLFGEAPDGSLQPVQVAVPVSVFEKKWRLVVDRQDEQGVSLAKETYEKMTLEEAAEAKQAVSIDYFSEGWEAGQTRVELHSREGNQKVLIYVEPE